VKQQVILTRTEIGLFAIPASHSWIRAMLVPRIAGAYVMLQDGIPIYVGRSDRCLRQRLLTHEKLALATHLHWRVCATPRKAFEQESFWFDHFSKVHSLHNSIHPAVPNCDPRPCPYCELEAKKVAMAFARLAENDN
jgi:hypothetical protein